MWCSKENDGPPGRIRFLEYFRLGLTSFQATNYGRPERKRPSLLPSHELRMSREEKAFTAWPKIHSHSQIFRYGESIFCLPHRPNFSDIFDLCLHRVSVVRASWQVLDDTHLINTSLKTRKLTTTKIVSVG